MTKCCSNRDRFILRRVLLAMFLAIIIPANFVITSLAINGFGIWWNIWAASDNAIVINVEIVTTEYSASYYNAYITFNYNNHTYRDLLCDAYYPRDRLDQELEGYKVGAQIVVYYNSEHPEDVRLHRKDWNFDLVVFGLGIFLFLQIVIPAVLLCRPKIEEIPSDFIEHKQIPQYTAVSVDKNINNELQPIYV